MLPELSRVARKQYSATRSGHTKRFPEKLPLITCEGANAILNAEGQIKDSVTKTNVQGVHAGEAEKWFASHKFQPHPEARQRRVDSERNVYGREKPLKNSAIATT